MDSFTTTQNIQLLWEVLLDELSVNKNNTTLLQNIRLVFDKNITLFSSKLTNKIPLISANKHFLSQMVIAINKLFPNIKTEQPKLITISNEEITNPYKIEDIQSARQSDFENQFEKRKSEFESLINTPKPKEIDLKYNVSEERIVSMDNLIADKMAEREYDMKIQADPNAQQWLQPKETSVKNNNTNNSNTTSNINTNTNANQKLKYLNLDNSDNIKLNVFEKSPVDKKKVSWNDINESVTTNIFSKLKTTKVVEELNLNPELNENSRSTSRIIQYAEQKSSELPDVNLIQPINLVQNNTNTNTNNPIIPSSQVIKQINELTNKINELTNKINELTNIVNNLTNKSNEDSLKLDNILEIVSLLYKQQHNNNTNDNTNEISNNNTLDQ
jgi:hypothetical protein